MASDQLENLIKVDVSTTYGAGDTAIVLAGGEGAELPDPANGEYNLVSHCLLWMEVYPITPVRMKMPNGEKKENESRRDNTVTG